MKGDFTRFTHRPEKHYTRVLKQQGRVDLDADWNESVEIFTQLERTEAVDVIGRCGVPLHGGGFHVDIATGEPTISRGRIYVAGILCSNESDDATDPIPLGNQPDLPGYAPALVNDGVYLAYLDVWERHVTALEDPDIREVALGGPDTTTRTRTLCQVKLHPLSVDVPLDTLECQPFEGPAVTGRLAARSEEAEESSTPCVVPASAGYRGLENRLYRVEIHDDGSVSGTVTFKWSRDNGSVVLPIAESGIDVDKVTLKSLGPDEVLTVKDDDWVEVLGDKTELYGLAGTLAQVEPDGVDKAKLEVELTDDVSTHAAEGHLKMRRWDHHATDDVALVNGALPIQGDWFELEDGVQVRFDTAAGYQVGDYWVIPARTRKGTVEWPEEGGLPAELPRLGIEHHHCTLALLRREDGEWTDERDCRRRFPPLTEVGAGCCCIRVAPGESVQTAVDTVVAQGGGCVILCRGVHPITGPLWLGDAKDVTIRGENAATVLRFDGVDENGDGGIVVESGERIAVEDLFVVSDSVPALVDVRPDDDWLSSRQVALRRLLMLNLPASRPTGVSKGTGLSCAVRLAHVEGVTLEACRIVAEVGIASLWGDALPDPKGEGESPASAAGTVGFEELAAGTELRVGEAMTDSGIEITGEAYDGGGGEMTVDGFARVEQQGQAGGSGNDLAVNSINLSFAIAEPVGEARLRFGDYGGSVNLRVNQDQRVAGSFARLHGETVGGVRVEVQSVAGSPLGRLRLVADTAQIGDLAVGGQELWIDDVSFGGAPDLRYGAGAAEVELRDCRLRYRDYGVLSMRSERWQLDRCEIENLDQAVWPELFRLYGSVPELPKEAVTTSGARSVRRQNYGGLRKALEVFLAEPATVLRGVAIQAFLWRDCAVRHCRLAGGWGIETWWWMGGGAIGNRIRSSSCGLFGFWIRDTEWSGNRITCTEGPVAAFVGGCRPTIAANRAQGGLGCVKVALREVVPLVLYRHQVLGAVRAYGGASSAGEERRVLWLFLEESAELMGLTWLVDGSQEVLDASYVFTQTEVGQAILAALGYEPPFDEPPAPVLYLLAGELEDSLAAFLENPKEPPRWVELGPVIPLIAAVIAENDLRATRDTVLIEQFLTMGGLRIVDNRLESTGGQTVCVNTWPYAANVSVVEAVVPSFLEALETLRGYLGLVAAWEPDNTDLRTAWEPIRLALWKLFRGDGEMAVQIQTWTQQVKGLYGTDYRIAGNTLRSRNTAIESNIFELAILRNHVTMLERPIPYKLVKQVVETLRRSRFLQPVGEAVAMGDLNAIASVPDGFDKKEDETFNLYLDDNKTYRSKLHVADTASPLHTGARVDTLVTKELVTNVESDVQAVEAAVDMGNLTLAAELAATLGQRLVAALNSFGIWAKGAGCRIVGNHVLVPDDAEEDSWARGGIRLQGDDKTNMMILLLGVLAELATHLDPLLGVTETVIDANEVIGGAGNGIDVLEISGGDTTKRLATKEFEDILPFQALFDLKVRSNQIRRVAGTGLSIDSATLAIDVEVEDNLFIKCGGDGETRFSSKSGGIEIATAALCRLHGNQVNRCGKGAQAGIWLSDIFGLTMGDNRVLRSGNSGGVVLQRILGHAEVCDNQFLYNPATGLLWNNSIFQMAGRSLVKTDLLNLAYLAELSSVYLGKEVKDDIFKVHVQIEDNLFRSMLDATELYAAFDINLAAGRLILSGNSSFGSGNLARVSWVGSGVVNGNLFEAPEEWATLEIDHMGLGVVTSNVCTSGRAVQITNSPSVQHGFNLPPT